MACSLYKSNSDSPRKSDANNQLALELTKSESAFLQGDYINFCEDYEDDDNEDVDVEDQNVQEKHPCHSKAEVIQKLLIDKHSHRVTEIYRQMVSHVENCQISFCNFIFMCPKMQEYSPMFLEMDLPQIGCLEIDSHGKMHTLGSLCYYGGNLNAKMKEEFIDFFVQTKPTF